MVNLVNSERVVGRKVSLTALELTVATTTVPPVGHRALELAEEIPGDGPDSVPVEEPRFEDAPDESGYRGCVAEMSDESPNDDPLTEPRLHDEPDDSANEGCPTGMPAESPEGAGATGDEPPAVCPRTRAKTLEERKREYRECCIMSTLFEKKLIEKEDYFSNVEKGVYKCKRKTWHSGHIFP